MEKARVRWEAKRTDSRTTRYALRTQPKGKGIEIGAYSSWDNPKAAEASEPVMLAIEQRARDLGYKIGRDSWNDLAADNQ
jgi:hypothetical protein